MTTTAEWLGNQVRLDEIEDTELTVVQWWRPRHGSQRGFRVLGRGELARLRDELAGLERHRAGTDGAADGDRPDTAAPDGVRFLRPDLAGTPLQLEALVDDLLGR